MASEPEFKPVFDSKAVKANLDIESNFMAADGFYSNAANLGFRKLAVCVIATHCSGVEVGMDAFVPYLAMNYFDRFISKTEKPCLDVVDVRKVAITCLFIAAKVRASSAVFFAENIPLEFDIEIIEGMEQRIISGLKKGLLLSSLLAAADIAYPAIQIDTPNNKLAFCAKKLIDLCNKKINIESAEPETASSSSATVAMALGKSEEVAAETESDQQRLSKEVAEAYEEVEAAESKQVMIVEIEDEELTESDKQREAKGKAQLVVPVIDLPEEEGEEETDKAMFTSEAPKTLMNFHVLWPTSVCPS